MKREAMQYTPDQIMQGIKKVAWFLHHNPQERAIFAQQMLNVEQLRDDLVRAHIQCKNMGNAVNATNFYIQAEYRTAHLLLMEAMMDSAYDKLETSMDVIIEEVNK